MPNRQRGAVICDALAVRALAMLPRWKIDYALGVTGHEDRVYDGTRRFNVLRKDVDYFWFGIAPENALATYQSLRPVQFDLYEIIARTRPKLTSAI